MFRNWFGKSLASEETRFVGIPRWAAVSILAAAVVMAGIGVRVSPTLERWPLGGMGVPDLDLYRKVVDRVQQGEKYYDVIHEELGPPPPGHIRSMFEYRQPTYAWLLAALPDPGVARWVLLALATLSVAVAVCTFLPSETGLIPLIGGTLLLLGGTFAWSFYEPELYLSTEPWCEPLLLLSLCAYARGHWLAGMLAALCALTLRELVLPFCLVAAVLSVWQRRWLEVFLWACCLSIYLGLLYLHSSEIASRNPATSPAGVDRWLQLRGLSFVILSGAMNIVLRPLPTWLFAIYLPIALLGLAGWKGEAGSRVALSAACYVVAFLFVWGGSYWGFLYTPMLILGFCRAPAALWDLWHAVRRSPNQASGVA